MKRIYIAAAALLLGTSAFAWAQSGESIAPDAKDAVAAATTTWQDEPAPAVGDPDLDLADTPDPEATDTGIGGPDEAADVTTEAAATTVATAELAPRPAAQNYPPCDPGPGDDNCIQLYEPGVRLALASWTQPTGGLAQPGEAMAAAEPVSEPKATAVGGPYEPIADDGADETAMAGDGVLEPEVGETAA